MIFHENRLLADDSHEISYLFFQKRKDVANFVICSSRDWRFKGKGVVYTICLLLRFTVPQDYFFLSYENEKYHILLWNSIWHFTVC